MPDIEENKTVDIDTSGPSVDVELENDSKETENELEVKNENTKDNNESNDSSEKSSEQLDVQVSEQKEEKKEDELKEYSESVQKRIAKLTKKWREAERQKDEALSYAERIMADKKRADEKLSKLEPGYMKSTEDSIKSGLESAKAKLAAARESNDLQAESEALTAISELGYKQARFLEAKAQQEEEAKLRESRPKQTDLNVQRQQISQGTPDPKAEDWATKNTWFGRDTAMTYTAFDLHKKLTEEEGYDPQSDEYYAEIDKRIRLEFPHKFGNNSNTTAESTKPVQTVASATRSTKAGRKTVRLTPSEVAIAKKLGVSLEDYAKQKKHMKEV